jgi:hypothetical protein
MLKMSSTGLNARTDTSHHGLSHPSKVLGAVANVYTGTKCFGEISRHLQLKLNTTGILNVRTDKNLID